MNTVLQPKSVSVGTRLSPDLNARVEVQFRERGYRKKAHFIEEAIRNHVELCERQQVGQVLPLAESPQTQN